jgi:alpha/beta superfamily hydrolase
MKQDTSVKVKYGVWGLAFGAVVAMIVGFGWGGWVTGSTAKGNTDEAVLASRAAICVAQFMRAPNHDQELLAFKETDSWKRSELIGKGGWDKMPGQGEANGAVAEACARGIEVLATG